MPSRNTIEIIVQGEDRASKVIGQVNTSLDTLGKFALGAVAGGVTAATAAVLGFSGKALAEFTTFEKGMAEVFTLLPGITETAMDEMISQVQYAANVFGILPNEVVPAVYQAISAGVPADNVLDFISTASKAAIGGVTTLETAVDGISSVVNAYGREVLSAQQASDLLFTAVKLGKTDFTQLSNSLFNVVPTAASLGVGLEQVTAALAVMTAQGTPTSVATTQLRQLFIELSKEGTKLNEIFMQTANQSFTDFIKNGGNVGEALDMIRSAVGGSDDEFRNLFGSVEAMNAALGISGPNAESFASALDQMAQSAGATDKAFNTMTKTIAFQANRLQAKLSNLFINFGRQLEPFAAKAIEQIGDIVSVLDTFLSGDMSEGGDNFTGIARGLWDFLKQFQPAFEELKRLINGFFGAIQAGIPFIDALRVYINAILPPELLEPFNQFINLIAEIGRIIGQVLEPIITWVQENVKLQDVLLVIGGAIASVVIPAIVSLVAGLASFLAPIAAIIAAVVLLRKAWETDFLGIRTFILDKVLPALQQLAQWFTETALPAIITFIETKAIPAIQEVIRVVGEIWERVRPTLEDFARWWLEEHLPRIVAFINDIVIPAVEHIIQIISDIWTAVSPALGEFANWFLDTGLPAIVETIKNVGTLAFITFRDVVAGLWNFIRNPLETLKTGIQNVFNFIRTNIIDPVISTIQNIGTTIQNVLQQLGIVENRTANAQAAVNNLANNPAIATQNPASLFGYANGIEYVDRDRIVKVHRGESILTADETAARANGENATNNYITIQLNGSYSNQQEANQDADMMIDALRRRGINLSRT